MAVSRGRGGRGRGGARGGSRGGGTGRGAGWSRGSSQARREEQEIADLEARIAHGAPPRGSNPLASDTPAPASAAGGGSTPAKAPPSPAHSLKHSDAKRKGREQGREGEGSDDPRTKPYVGAKLFAELPLSERTQRGLRVRARPSPQTLILGPCTQSTPDMPHR